MTRRLVLPAVLTQREAATALEAMGALASASTPIRTLPSGETPLQVVPGSSGGLTTPCWSVDASALTDFDSSALAVLLECKRVAAAAKCALVIDSPPPKLVRLAGLYGLDEVLLGEAIAAQDAADLTA